MKLFQLTLPNEKHSQIVSYLQDDLKISNVSSIEARTSSIVTFRLDDNDMQDVLIKLQKKGVGVEFGFCDVMALTPGTTISINSDPLIKKKNKMQKIRAAMMQRSVDAGTSVSVAEMFASIEANTTLSRDSLCMLLISSSLAGIGLALDQSTTIVASMLISPMMGPVLGCAFGFSIRDRNMFVNGFFNELLAIVITLLLGIIVGSALTPYAGMLKWPTNEMRARGQAIQLLFGAIVALLSGIASALSESNKNISSVVGTAIAAALLPPTVNCGICLAYAIIGRNFVAEDEKVGEEEQMIFYEIAVGSALLVWINIIFIYITAVMTFKIKGVGKFHLVRRRDEDTWQNLPRLQHSPKPKTRSQDRFTSVSTFGIYPTGNEEEMPLSPSSDDHLDTGSEASDPGF